jgi:ClpP class serine protease
VKSIATARGKSEDDVWALIDGAPYTPQEAVDKGLVDGIAYPQGPRGSLRRNLPGRVQPRRELPRQRRHEGMARTARARRDLRRGEITTGRSSPPGLFGGGSSAGSDTIVDAIERRVAIPR